MKPTVKVPTTYLMQNLIEDSTWSLQQTCVSQSYMLLYSMEWWLSGNMLSYQSTGWVLIHVPPIPYFGIFSPRDIFAILPQKPSVLFWSVKFSPIYYCGEKLNTLYQDFNRSYITSAILFLFKKSQMSLQNKVVS